MIHAWVVVTGTALVTLRTNVKTRFVGEKCSDASPSLDRDRRSVCNYWCSRASRSASKTRLAERTKPPISNPTAAAATLDKFFSYKPPDYQKLMLVSQKVGRKKKKRVVKGKWKPSLSNTT